MQVKFLIKLPSLQAVVLAKIDVLQDSGLCAKQAFMVHIFWFQKYVLFGSHMDINIE